jgi:diaminohydroxyphosphoribosylaminopyrimidine deaminase/5-amino-6-(5-phosphoribosylamino)uracil reductase
VIVKTAHHFAAREDAERFLSDPQALFSFPLDALRKSMKPPVGKKVFTSETSLRKVHELRRQSGAILTGSGTVLADSPLLTIRRLPDHPRLGQPRVLVLLDRRGRIPASYLAESNARGFEILRPDDSAPESLHRLLLALGARGVQQLLVEVGPEVSHSLLTEKLEHAGKRVSFWDEAIHFVSLSGETEDRVLVRQAPDGFPET